MLNVVVLSKHKKLRLIRYKFHLVLSAVLLGEEEEMMEVVNVVGQESSIIGKRDAGDSLAPDSDAQLRGLREGGLLVVIQFILI